MPEVDPGDPTDFSVTAGASNFAGSWNAPSQSTGAVTYRYGYRKSGTSSWSNRTTSSTSFTLSHTNLTGGDDYDFRVRTEDDSGNSGYVTDSATVPSGSTRTQCATFRLTSELYNRRRSYLCNDMGCPEYRWPGSTTMSSRRLGLVVQTRTTRNRFYTVGPSPRLLTAPLSRSG